MRLHQVPRVAKEQPEPEPEAKTTPKTAPKSGATAKYQTPKPTKPKADPAMTVHGGRRTREGQLMPYDPSKDPRVKPTVLPTFWLGLLAVLVGLQVLARGVRLLLRAVQGFDLRRMLSHWDNPLTWLTRLRLPLWTSRAIWPLLVFVVAAITAPSARNAQLRELAVYGNRPYVAVMRSAIYGCSTCGLLLLSAFLFLRVVRRARKLGNARFFEVEHEFGRSGDTVGALVVARPDGEGARRGFRSAWLPWQVRYLFLPWQVLSRHVLVIGNSGAGKTTGVFTHLMVSVRTPWIYQDQKGDLPMREDFPGRPVWGLDARGYETRSGVWNPMEEVQSAEEAELLAAVLSPDAGDQNDWIRRGARQVLDALLKVRHWGSLQELAAFIEARPMEEVFELLPPGMSAAIAGDPKTRGYYQQHLLEVLRPWTSARIAEITDGTSTVTLQRYMEEGGYVLSNEGQKELRAPINLFWNLLFLKLRTRPDDSKRLLLLLDEFGDAGKIQAMENQLALLRSKGVSIVAGIQTEPLLKATYGETWEAVKSGFGSVLFFPKNSDPNIREQWSKYLGNMTDKRGGGIHLNLVFGFIPVGWSRPQEAATPLVSPDAWNDFAEADACLGVFNRPTWFVPKRLFFTSASPGKPKPEVQDWRAEEASRMEALRSRAEGASSAPGKDTGILDRALKADPGKPKEDPGLAP